MTMIRNLIRPLRNFWHDRQKRQTTAIICGVIGALALLYGLYTTIDAHWEYNRLSDQFENTPIDVTSVDRYDAMWLAMIRRDMMRAQTRRGRGVLFLGAGLVGLGLAYFFYPTDPKAPPTATENILPG